MARYVDIELIDPEDFENCSAYQAREMINDIPTADVVPRAEVTKLVGAYYDKCDECRTKCARAIANEIFEDIDLNLEDYMLGDINGRAMVARLSQLKKKYTDKGGAE